MVILELEFTVSGKRIRVKSEDIPSKLSRAKFGPIRTHAVRIDGELYPIKEAFARVSGLDLLDFNTNQARTWFRRLGFEAIRMSSPKPSNREHADG